MESCFYIFGGRLAHFNQQLFDLEFYKFFILFSMTEDLISDDEDI